MNGMLAGDARRHAVGAGQDRDAGIDQCLAGRDGQPQRILATGLKEGIGSEPLDEGRILG